MFGSQVFFWSSVPCTWIAAIAPWVRPEYISSAMLAETKNSPAAWCTV